MNNSRRINSRFMVLHPNGLVLQMYCVLRVLDAVAEICQPRIAKLRTYFRLRENCHTVSKGRILRIGGKGS